MDKTAIYILAGAVGAGLGIISMVIKNNKKGPEQHEAPEHGAEHVLKEEDAEARLEESGAPIVQYSAGRVSIKGMDIYITNSREAQHQDIEIRPIIKFENDVPVIAIYENGYLYRSFTVEPKAGNENLAGQYFHASVRVNANSSVQMDGIISKSATNPDMTDYEGIRLQPFFLSDKSEINKSLEGKGMFARGLHYSGLISSGNIRLICICDSCLHSFSVEFIHAGFSDVQYFYSENSRETLLVPYGATELGSIPTQLQKEIDDKDLELLEANLPEFEDGKFRYYNGFKCPHCGIDYIDFRNNKEMRPGEYYANFYLNQRPLSYNVGK